MGQENLLVRCGHCGAKNRVPRSRTAERAVCGKCRGPLSLSNVYPDHPVEVSDGGFRDEVLSFPGVVAVEFWTPRCGYCRAFEPTFRGLAQEFRGKVKFVKLNIDQNGLTPSHYSITGTPTLLFFQNGRQVNRVDGVAPRPRLEGILRNLL